MMRGGTNGEMRKASWDDSLLFTSTQTCSVGGSWTYRMGRRALEVWTFISLPHASSVAPAHSSLIPSEEAALLRNGRKNRLTLETFCLQSTDCLKPFFKNKGKEL